MEAAAMSEPRLLRSIAFKFPYRIDSHSGLNGRMNHWDKAETVAAHRRIVWAALSPFRTAVRAMDLPMRIHLVRFAPARMDHDNLQGVFKSIRDQLALEVNVDDRSPFVRWSYGQTEDPDDRSLYAVSVRIEEDPCAICGACLAGQRVIPTHRGPIHLRPCEQSFAHGLPTDHP
jgi:hypothetical protein